MNTPPNDERSLAAESSGSAEDTSPWVWRTKEQAMARMDERYPWLSNVIGKAALYRLAFDILLEKRDG